MEQKIVTVKRTTLSKECETFMKKVEKCLEMVSTATEILDV